MYARKSTDDTAKAEDNRSTTRQVELASTYAAAKGWTVDPAAVFVDDGVSGAEFKDRPGLMRLLAHTRDFDVLVLRDTDRLGRDGPRTMVLLDDLIASGKRIFYYSNDAEELLDSPQAKMMASLVSFVAEMERDKASAACAR